MITFILPTKNRVKTLNIFFKNTYKKFNKLNPNYLIIDASNNKNHFQNKTNLKNYKKIKIIRQKTKGIQMGCIEAIPFIKTKYVTFLYDDDVMGQYVIDIYKKNMKNPDTFSLGCGIVQDIKKKIKFQKLNYLTLDKKDILSCYYGSSFRKILRLNKINKKLALPVSPICTSFRTEFLIKWKKILFNFTKKNDFRNYIFFKKDVGPDMIIYLMQLNDSKNYVNFYYPHSVKFSSHNDSISIIYGNNFLRIGYWLARICFFKNKKFDDFKIKNNYYTYLIIIGLILIFTNLNNFYYIKNIFIEFFKLLKTGNKFSFKYFFCYIYERSFI